MGYALEHVIGHLYSRAQHTNGSSPIPEFVIAQLAMEVILVAKYLECYVLRIILMNDGSRIQEIDYSGVYIYLSTVD